MEQEKRGAFPGNGWWWVGLLIILSLWPYAPVGDFDFINWDDPYYITENTMVRQGLSWSAAGSVWKLAHPYPMPLAYLTFMAEVELFGLDGGAFHWIGVAGHLINGLLFFALVWRLSGNSPLAFLAAAWFSLHPLRVEAVVWISEQKEIGAALFGLLALHGYLSHVRRKQPSPLLSLAVLAHLASMLYKPQWVTLPILLLLLDYWPLQRHQKFIDLLIEKKWFFTISTCFALLTLLSFDNHARLTDLTSLNLTERLANSIAFYGGFIEKTFLPVELTPYLPFVHHVNFLWLITLCLASWLLWRFRSRWPWLLMGWLWFLVSLLPLSGLFAGGEAICRADRWSYLPHMGLMLALAHTAMGLARPWQVIAMVSLPLLAWMSGEQTKIWRDSGTLWQHTLTLPGSGDSFYPRIQLGKYYLEQSRPDLALPLFQQARNLAPENPLVALELANLLTSMDRQTEAWPHFQIITTLAASTPKLLSGTAMAFLLNRHPKEAIVFLQAALQRWPNLHQAEMTESRFMLALAYEADGRPDQGQPYLHSFLTNPPHLHQQRCLLAREALLNNDGLTRYPHTNQRMLTACSKISLP